MSTGMRKWMEKDCPDIPFLPAEVSIDREELKQLREELAQYKNERDALRAKLEAAESEALEEARLNGMGSEREAALLSKLEAAEKERDALRAKVAEMERQEPVGEIQRANSTGNYICSEVWVPLPVGSKLYALPGAKGEEK